MKLCPLVVSVKFAQGDYRKDELVTFLYFKPFSALRKLKKRPLVAVHHLDHLKKQFKL